MSERINPSFEVDGKKYEFIFTRYLQVKYQNMTSEKRKDTKYQTEIAEYNRLKEEYETISERYKKARESWLDNPLDEKTRSIMEALEPEHRKAYNSFIEYSANHSSPNEADEYALYIIGELILSALQEQYDLSAEESRKVWDKYVSNAGQLGSMEFLAYVGRVWLVDIDEEPENPFIKEMRKKYAQNGKAFKESR